jgi:4-amino-4-deoxy-L-arabinose transferase-like glycosyltransferase
MFGPINKTPALLTPVGILIVGALYALVWFASLDYRHLIPSDEGRYAEIAREMLVSGDWISPRYHDYKYFFKPPLQLWATVIAFDWFGVGEWQARLWGALTGF